MALVKSRALPLFERGIADATAFMRATDAVAYDVLSGAITTGQGRVCGASLSSKLGMLTFMERNGRKGKRLALTGA